MDDVANLWWFFNARKVRDFDDEGGARGGQDGLLTRLMVVGQDWDKGTLASEVVEEYGSHCRLVYIKGRHLEGRPDRCMHKYPCCLQSTRGRRC